MSIKFNHNSHTIENTKSTEPLVLTGMNGIVLPVATANTAGPRGRLVYTPGLTSANASTATGIVGGLTFYDDNNKRVDIAYDSLLTTSKLNIDNVLRVDYTKEFTGKPNKKEYYLSWDPVTRSAGWKPINFDEIVERIGDLESSSGQYWEPSGTAGSFKLTSSTGYDIVIGDAAKSILPKAANTNTIGTQTLPFKDLYVGGIKCTSIFATQNVQAYSDIRLKTDIKRIENPLHKIHLLGGYTYSKTVDGLTKKEAGIIAQEVHKVLPEAIEEHNGYLTVSYNSLVALSIEAIKELQREVEYLKSPWYKKLFKKLFGK